MLNLTFIKASQVRKHCNAKGKRVTPEFLMAVDSHIRQKLNTACGVHNGGRTTLDATVAGFAGIAGTAKIGGPLI